MLTTTIFTLVTAGLAVSVFLLVKSTKTVEILEDDKSDLQRAVVDARADRDDALRQRDAARVECAALNGKVAEAQKARGEAEGKLAETDKELARSVRAHRAVCHATGIPMKGDYSDGDIAEFGRKAKMRAQLGPEINYIFRTAAKRGLV